MKATWFDRFVMVFAPQWGLERVKARHAATLLARHYEAATQSRRTSGWSRTGADADRVIAPVLGELRMHARDLIRNNAWAKRAQRIIANNTVGWGIMPQAVDPEDAGVGVRTETQDMVAAEKAWALWAGSTQCESEGRHTFIGLQRLAMRSIVESGEVLIRRRFRRAKDGLTIPMQLQVLEADFLDHNKEAITSLAGGPIIQGVEFDLLGRRAAYWLFEQHPGSARLFNPVSRRISAEDVIHVFYAERPGQTRGVSWLANAIVTFKDLDEFDDAELMKQKIAACFAAFVTDAQGTSAQIGEADVNGEDLETFEPGMISYLPPGKQISFGNPPGLTSDTLPTRALRRLAAGLGITYEDLTGDYSNVNFSSARMARLAHWANVADWEESMLIPLLCEPVWNWAMQALLIAGEISAAPRAEWTCSPMPMIEPDKEGTAIQRLVRTGAVTPSEMVRQQGRDPRKHWAEMEADFKELKRRGLVLDIDPAAVSQAGLTQERVGGGAGGKPGQKALPAKSASDNSSDET